MAFKKYSSFIAESMTEKLHSRKPQHQQYQVVKVNDPAGGPGCQETIFVTKKVDDMVVIDFIMGLPPTEEMSRSSGENEQDYTTLLRTDFDINDNIELRHNEAIVFEENCHDFFSSAHGDVEYDDVTDLVYHTTYMDDVCDDDDLFGSNDHDFAGSTTKSKVAEENTVPCSSTLMCDFTWQRMERWNFIENGKGKPGAESAEYYANEYNVEATIFRHATSLRQLTMAADYQNFAIFLFFCIIFLGVIKTMIFMSSLM
ncbi:uncharacterized protein LOC143446521 isoform X1 [Clavelina lepadiformis]|uniref:uncharacterized protein LOC143446521 isoform X1 n=1 Tax=Clavelina lepadiformis TaxID=159417 RepID=UPI00404173E3